MSIKGDDSGNRAWGDSRLLFKEGSWGLHSTGPDTYTAKIGWQSVISHNCVIYRSHNCVIYRSPCWMLIEWHANKTVCFYCSEPMPDGIVALFKFHNEKLIK